MSSVFWCRVTRIGRIALQKQAASAEGIVVTLAVLCLQLILLFATMSEAGSEQQQHQQQQQQPSEQAPVGDAAVRFEDLTVDDDLPIIDRIVRYCNSQVALQRLVHVKMLAEAAELAG